MNTDMTGLSLFSKNPCVFGLWTKVASALEGLIVKHYLRSTIRWSVLKYKCKIDKVLLPAKWAMCSSTSISLSINISHTQYDRVILYLCKCVIKRYTVKPTIVNTLDMWAPNINMITGSNFYLLHYENTSEMWTPNVKTIDRSQLYLLHYENTSEMWTPNVKTIDRSQLYLLHYEITSEMWTPNVKTIDRSQLYLLHYENTSEMWTPNVKTIDRSQLYLLHYENTSEMWTTPYVNTSAMVPRCSHFWSFIVIITENWNKNYGKFCSVLKLGFRGTDGFC